MADRSLVPRNGAIELGSYAADFQAFSIRAAQGVEGVTPFGPNTCSKNVGAGTPDFAFSIQAAAVVGTTSAGSGVPPTYSASGIPNIGNPELSTNSGIFNPTGLTGVFTLDTGCTESCNVVVGDYTIGVARMRAAVPVGINGKNYNDVSEAWASS